MADKKKYKFTYTPNHDLVNTENHYKNELVIEFSDTKLKIKNKNYDMGKKANKNGDIMDLCDYIAGLLGTEDFELSFDFKEKTFIIRTNIELTDEFKEIIKGNGKIKEKIKKVKSP